MQESYNLSRKKERNMVVQKILDDYIRKNIPRRKKPCNHKLQALHDGASWFQAVAADSELVECKQHGKTIVHNAPG